MYLRYGDPSWDSPESAEAPASNAPAGGLVANESGRASAQGALQQPMSRQSQPGATVARPGDRSPAAARLPKVDLSGVIIHAITERQTIDYILDELDAGRGGVVITPNLDHI